MSGPKGPTSTVEVRNAQPLDTSINVNCSTNEDPTPTFSNLIVRELFDNSSADIYLHWQMNFTRDVVVT